MLTNESQAERENRRERIFITILAAILALLVLFKLWPMIGGDPNFVVQWGIGS